MLLNATTFTIGLLYAAFVHVLKRQHPTAPTSALFVVIGNVLIAAYLWQRHGSAAARAAVTANLLLGIPQIIGYHARTLAETADLLDRTITYGD